MQDYEYEKYYTLEKQKVVFFLHPGSHFSIQTRLTTVIISLPQKFKINVFYLFYLFFTTWIFKTFAHHIEGFQCFL